MDFKHDRLSKYREIKCVHQGEGRAAYLCESKDDKSLVVVKKISIRNVSRQEQEEAIREAEILKMLKHPNIIQFKDFIDVRRDYICIIMDYADGGDLASKIKQTETYFSETQILDWFVQIVLAIKHMHDRKIVHRDIKSSNIFLTSMNVVKLGDFGISSCLSHTNDFLQSFAGTYFYLSPEIINNQPYNYKTDIWSLGVVLYELCTLHPPFTTIKNDKKMLESKIKAGKYKEIPMIYSQEMKNLVASLLTVSHTKRPSVKEILQLPIIKARIKNFLTEFQYADEFSHTVIHKVKFMPETPLFNLNSSPLGSNNIAKEEKHSPLIPKGTPILDNFKSKSPVIKEAKIAKPQRVLKAPVNSNSPFLEKMARQPLFKPILPNYSPSNIKDDHNSNLQRIQEELDNLLKKHRNSNAEELLRPRGKLQSNFVAPAENHLMRQDVNLKLFKKNHSEADYVSNQLANANMRLLPEKQVRHLKKHISIQDGLIPVMEKPEEAKNGAFKFLDSSEERINKEKRQQFYKKVEFLKKELKETDSKSTEVIPVSNQAPLDKKSNSISIENICKKESVPQNEQGDFSLFSLPKVENTQEIAAPASPEKIILNEEVKMSMIQKDKEEYEELLHLYRDVLAELEEPTIKGSAIDIHAISQSMPDHTDLLRSIYAQATNENDSELNDLHFEGSAQDLSNVEELEKQFGMGVYAKFVLAGLDRQNH